MSRDDDQLRLRHMIRCIDKIERYVNDTFQDGFESDEMMQDAVLKNLEIIGEAATKLSKALKEEHSTIPWKQIEGLRHRLVHDYYQVDLTIVWNTIQNRLPHLRQEIETLLS